MCEGPLIIDEDADLEVSPPYACEVTVHTSSDNDENEIIVVD